MKDWLIMNSGGRCATGIGLKRKIRTGMQPNRPAHGWSTRSSISTLILWIIIQKRIYCRVRSQTKKQPRFYQMLFRLSWTGTSTLQSIQKRPGRKSKWERAFMECSGMLTRRTVWAISQLKNVTRSKCIGSRELIKSRNPGTCFIWMLWITTWLNRNIHRCRENWMIPWLVSRSTWMMIMSIQPGNH